MRGQSDVVEQAIARSLMQHRCLGCGGALTVLHWCPCCLQLVHPGCECVSCGVRLGVRPVGAGVSMEVQQKEERSWQ